MTRERRPHYVDRATAFGVYDVQHGLIDVVFTVPKASELRAGRHVVYAVDIVPTRKIKEVNSK